MSDSPNYLFAAKDKPSLPIRQVPLLIANADNLKGYGFLVDDPEKCEVEIVTWPAQGWRPIDAGTGNEGGTVEGIFHCHWDGDVLMGRNDAVAGHYVLGWSQDPQQAQTDTQSAPREQVLLWHMNYHPDGGQMFFPQQNKPFVVPLALPGDDLQPEQIVAFWCDGSKGLCIHPNIWHEGIFPCLDRQSFRDRQGKVHARVSCDLGQEFGCYLGVPLPTEQP
jgi:hypothetical protein